MRFCERVSCGVHMASCELNPDAWHQLKGGQIIAGSGFAETEKARDLFQTIKTRKGNLLPFRLWKELQCCRRDQAQSPFCTHKEVFQIIAGIIFAQLVETI